MQSAQLVRCYHSPVHHSRRSHRLPDRPERRTHLAGDFSRATCNRTRRLDLTDGRVTARFNDGSPALVEGRRGKGRILIRATGLDRFWNNLPLQPVHLPFVHRMTRFLCSRGEIQPWHLAGSTVNLSALAEAGSTLAIPAGAVAMEPGGSVAVDPRGHLPRGVAGRGLRRTAVLLALPHGGRLSPHGLRDRTGQRALAAADRRGERCGDTAVIIPVARDQTRRPSPRCRLWRSTLRGPLPRLQWSRNPPRWP